MAQLRQMPTTDMQLLCLMEIWFDVTQPIVKALADYNYSTHFDGTVACSFCDRHYDEDTSIRIMTGQLLFHHYPECPVLLARRARETMIIDTEDDAESGDILVELDEDAYDGDDREKETTTQRPSSISRFVSRQLDHLRSVSDGLMNLTDFTSSGG